MNFLKRLKAHWILQTVLCALVLLPTPSLAVSIGQLLGMTEFLTMVAVIRETNANMNQAALNPMDEWRREAVRASIRKFPPALIGLAQAFESGKLHDGDYQFVMGLLGGFVDTKSAPQIYAQFLKNPSPSLIPRVGGPLQSEINSGGNSGSGNSAKLVMDESQSQGANYKGGASSSNSAQRVLGAEYADLSKMEVESEPSVTEPTRTPAQASNSTTTRAQEINQIASELENLEVNTTEEAPTQPAEKPVSRMKRVGKPGAKNGAKFWTPRWDILFVKTLLIQEAHAEAPPPPPGGGGQQQQSGCQNGQCGGGQGGSGSGSDSAAALFGAAAIMAAIAPVIAASIQADADKEIAKTNAEAQVQMTEITAQNAENLAMIQQQTTMYQTQTAATTADKNNQAAMEQLNAQLAQLESSQQKQYELEQQQLQAEIAYNNARLEQAAAEQQAALAQAQAEANQQLVMAGLSNGTVPGNSASDLTITSGGISYAPTGTGTAPGTGTTGTGTGNQVAINGEETTSGTALTGATTPRGMTGSSQGTPKNTAATGKPAQGQSTTTAALPATGQTTVPGTESSQTVALAGTSAKRGLASRSTESSSESEAGSSGNSSLFNSLFGAPSAPMAASQRLTDQAMPEGGPKLPTNPAQVAQVAAILKEQRELNGSTRALKARLSDVEGGFGTPGVVTQGSFLAASHFSDSESFFRDVESSSEGEFERHSGTARGLAGESAPRGLSGGGGHQKKLGTVVR